MKIGVPKEIKPQENRSGVKPILFSWGFISLGTPIFINEN